MPGMGRTSCIAPGMAWGPNWLALAGLATKAAADFGRTAQQVKAKVTLMTVLPPPEVAKVKVKSLAGEVTDEKVRSA